MNNNYLILIEKFEDDLIVEIDNFMCQWKWKKIQVDPNVIIYKLSKLNFLYYIRIEKYKDIFTVRFFKTGEFNKNTENFLNENLMNGEFIEFKRLFYIYKLKYNL